MKRFNITAVLLCIMLSTGCLSAIVKNSVKDTPIANRIDIHSGARTGDYAVLRAINSETSKDPAASMLAGNTTSTMKVLKKSNGYITIGQETSTSMIGGGFMNSLVFQITADYRGNVRSGCMIDTRSGEKTPLKIARNGDKNYYHVKTVSNTQLRKWGIPTRITVPAGTFSVTGKASVNTDGSESITVFLVNPGVKFGHVATYAVYPDSETGVMTARRVLELVEQGRK